MDAFLSHISLFASHNIVSAYVIVYLGTIFLGNIAAFTSLWLAFKGVFGAWGVLAVIFSMLLAGVTGDVIWYFMGRKLRETGLGNWFKRRMPGHATFENHIERRGLRYMLFAKFLVGSNFPLIFSIGWTRRLPFRTFFKNSLLALVIWMPIILGVSYGLYASLSPLAALQSTFKELELLVGGIAFFIILQYALLAAFRKLLGKNNGGPTS